jgi:hypothetical protein
MMSAPYRPFWMCFFSGVAWAVVEVKAGRARRELVDEFLARAYDLEHPVHVCRVDAMEVNCVRVGAAVHEPHPERVVFRRPDHRAGHGAVVCPGRKEHARGDLDLPVDRCEGVLAHASRPVRLRRGRTEKSVEVVRPADRGRLLPDHRRVPENGVVVTLVWGEVLVLPLALGQRELRERPGDDERRRSYDQPLARKFRHN